jgi:type I restriction enzyme S subunit
MIPAHWEVPPVYARFDIQLGKMLDEKTIRGTHLAPYLRNVDVQWAAINTIDLPEMDFNENDRLTYSLRAGDILMCEGGEIGRCSIWNGEIQNCYYQKALHRLRPIAGRDHPAFFVFVMQMLIGLGVLQSGSGTATIQHLPAERLRVIRYPAPPPTEQREIASYIAAETTQIDALRSATERTITLLRERRAALIAAAITGQIDVTKESAWTA